MDSNQDATPPRTPNTLEVCKGADESGDRKNVVLSLRRKAHVARRRRPVQSKNNRHVRFNDDITVNEYDNGSESELTNDELQRKQDIFKNMFQDDETRPINDDQQSRYDWAQKSAWKLATSVMAASRQLSWFRNSTDSLSSVSEMEESNFDDLERPDSSKLGNEESDESDIDTTGKFNIVYRRSTRQRVRKFSVPNIDRWNKPQPSPETKTSFEFPEKSRASYKQDKISSLDEKSISPHSSKRRVQRRFSSVESLEELTKSRPSLRNERNENKPDPFHCFEVEQEPCHLLTVTVLRGKNISKGRLQDMLDTPDPYVVVYIKEAPEGRKATTAIDNDINPEWNEKLVYLLPVEPEEKIVAEIVLLDANYSMDEILGTTEFEISSLPLDSTVKKTFRFNETSEVDFEFDLQVHNDHDLRLSLALCEDEKKFRSTRKRHVHSAMRKLMLERGDVSPRVLRETPTIAVIGSGGGFRAMTGFSGAMKALHDTGVLDCTTYVGGLSGSSWYLATLFAHEDFPHKATDAVNQEIRNNIQTSPFWLLRPECLMRYSQRLREKMKSGQPVTFTDFFGMLIGQTLLGAKKMNSAKLSDFAYKIQDGAAPMPLLTCLHVRPKTSALTFHDWLEFSPFEIGMAKYGTFMQTRHFGSKFFNGVLVKQYDESPLHFLMGVWGSAFSILFNRLVDKNKGNEAGDAKTDDVRGEMEKELHNEFSNEEERNTDDDNESGDEYQSDENDDDDDEFEDARDEPFDQQGSQESNKQQSGAGLFSSLWNWRGKTEEVKPDEHATVISPAESPTKGQKGFMNSIVSGVFGANFMESREYRAGKILNYMRGLSLNHTYPLSPFASIANCNSTIAEEGEFAQIREPIEVQQKRVHLVDAGLTFNSPYPAILRPQRFVDLIISFDFSARPSDNAQPFKEILLAEKWARLHHLPFPKIDRTTYDKEGLKECYVFKDEMSEDAPTIIHFVLCNLNFRNYIKPGVKRSAEDKRGNFSIFDAPKTPYSTFNFQYPNEAFDRLHNLMEFNTLLHIDTIVREIGNCIQLRRHSKTRGSISINDVRSSVYLSAKTRQSLEKEILGKGENGRLFLD